MSSTSRDHLSVLELDVDARSLLRTSIAHYQQHARLLLSVDTVNGKEVWCTAHQYEVPLTGTLLTQEQILERAQKVFAPLHAAGYEPIISVFTLEKGPPDKPVAKHRAASDIVMRGLRATVLRQAPPRMLFLSDAQQLKLLALEDVASGHFFEQLAYKANAWLKRSAYRDQS